MPHATIAPTWQQHAICAAAAKLSADAFSVKGESAQRPCALGEVRSGGRQVHCRRGVNVHAHLVHCGRRPQIWGVGVDGSHAHSWSVGGGVGEVWAPAKSL